MKKKDIKELYTKTIEELNTMEKLAREQLSQLNLDKSQNKLKDTRSIFWKRKEIAKILTILRLKQLAKVEGVK